MKKEEYIQYFLHIPKGVLSGMMWDDIAWNIHEATEVDKCFTKGELAEMFPNLLGFLTKERKVVAKEYVLPSGFRFSYDVYE